MTSFLNLRVLKLVDLELKTESAFKAQVLEPVLLLLPRLRSLKLNNVKLSTKT